MNGTQYSNVIKKLAKERYVENLSLEEQLIFLETTMNSAILAALNPENINNKKAKFMNGIILIRMKIIREKYCQ